jgi:hypothetical protein
MPRPSIAIIANDRMTFYRYTDASKSAIETAVAPRDARLVQRLFDALEWKPLSVEELTPQARDGLNLIP